MSASTADQPPATPDQAAGSASAAQGMASPVPPPPPFNTPAGGVTDSSDAPMAMGADAGGDGVTGSSLVDKLSGLSVGQEAGGRKGATDQTMRAGGEENGDEDEGDDEEGEEDEVDLPPEVMKRLYQLKSLQSEKDVVYEKYKAERAELEHKFASEYGAIYKRRAAVVAGRATESEAGATAEDDAGEGGVPHFWMQCMLHHEALHDVVCEPDLEALYYLSDVRCVDKEDLLGFTLEFHFDDNPFFSNAVLTKRYDTANIMDQGEPLLEGVEGTPIEWKAGRNLCEKTIRRKVKRGGSRSGETRTITKVEKLDSFFKFFQNPVMYEEEEDEEDDEYNFSFDMDYEVARIFRNHLIPNAVLWFTGEAAGDDDEETDEDDDEEDEEEGLEADALSEEGTTMRHDEEGSEDGDEDAGEEDGAPSKALIFQ